MKHVFRGLLAVALMFAAVQMTGCKSMCPSCHEKSHKCEMKCSGCGLVCPKDAKNCPKCNKECPKAKCCGKPGTPGCCK
jgi:hypothetical protein